MSGRRRRELLGLTGPLQLVAARARRRPGRWVWPALGLALAAAFACAVAAEGTIAGDRAARATLGSLSPLDRAVSVIQQGPATAGTDRRARSLIASLGLSAPTHTLLLNPVRLSGIVVRLAAIDPLAAWTGRSVRPCRATVCPVVQVGGTPITRPLTALGVHVAVARGAAALRSSAALGFVPAPGRGQPLLVTGDVTGLAHLPALRSLFRTEAWVSQPPLAALHSWQLAGLEHRLIGAQASLPADGSLTLTAPTDALQSARDRAADAGRRLLPAGGGALAALAMFVVLAAYGLRRDQQADRERLSAAGARGGQLVLFSLAEAVWLAAVAILAGAAVGVGAAAVLASGAGLPAGPVLAHSLISGPAAAAVLCGWAAAVAVIGAVLLLPGGRLVDALAACAAAALALALAVGPGNDATLATVAAPLACLAAAGVVFRVAGALLRGGERIARAGPLTLRLALVGLARAPAAPALAVAFVSVSVGLAGFALAYRATLQRGAADEAAQQVPLDALVGQSAAFTRPLAMRSIGRWQAMSAGGTVLPVRRTDATSPVGGVTASLTALGVPASGLGLIHSWRRSDGSAPIGVLAARLAPRGASRTPGPSIPAGVREISVRARALNGETELSADLRDRSGAVTQLPLGAAGGSEQTLRARLPARGGPYELEGLAFAEPTGAEALNGHQNAENPAAATQSTTRLDLGTVRAGPTTLVQSWAGWRGAGAAQATALDGGGIRVAFSDSGQPGVVRPRQPTDTRPVPVITDPRTATAVGPGNEIPLTIDGEPVDARVVGWVRRFPTIAPGGAGFVIADEVTLAGALDAALPGQGQADELWIDTPRPAALRRQLRTAPLDQLTTTFRSDLDRGLREDPVARGVQGTLVGAAAVSATLAILGLMAALAGAMRDRRVERDLTVLGLGPGARRDELRLRVMAAGVLGAAAGLALAALLTRLVVAAVRAAGAVAVPDPPLVTVAPWGELALLAIAAVAAFALTGTAAARLMRDAP